MSDKYIWLQETIIERKPDGQGFVIYDGEPYESYFVAGQTGEVYRHCQSEYGRCTGACYIDREDKAHKIGWVFEKRAKYTDCDETYLQETWVSLHTAPAKRTIEYSYAEVA